MGILQSCFTVRDDFAENSHHDSDSGNRLVYALNSLLNKIKEIFHINEEVLLIQYTQPPAAPVDTITAETLTSSSYCSHPYEASGDPYSAQSSSVEYLDKHSNTLYTQIEVRETSQESEIHLFPPINPNADQLEQEPSEQNTDFVTFDEAASSLSKEEEALHTVQAQVNSCPEEVSRDDGFSMCLDRPLNTNFESFFYEIYPSPDDEDVCSTCLEDYDPENPKIVAECSHHFHLSCIYDWMERSDKCPMCFRVMIFSETN